MAKSLLYRKLTQLSEEFNLTVQHAVLAAQLTREAELACDSFWAPSRAEQLHDSTNDKRYKSLASASTIACQFGRFA